MSKEKILNELHEMYNSSIINWIPSQQLSYCIKKHIEQFVENYMDKESFVHASIDCFQSFKLTDMVIHNVDYNMTYHGATKYYDDSVNLFLKTAIESSQDKNADIVGAFYSYLLVLALIFKVKIEDNLSIKLSGMLNKKEINNHVHFVGG